MLRIRLAAVPVLSSAAPLGAQETRATFSVQGGREPLAIPRLTARLARPLFFPVLCAVLLLPHAFTGPPLSPWFVRAGLPWILSGDEPHYLIMLHSLVGDGDLDLRNNYDAALRGSTDAGGRFARDPIAHHVGYYVDGTFHDWSDVFDPDRTPTDVGGRLEFPTRPGAPPGLAELPEYSTHPPGLPLLLAAALWPWRSSTHLESYALLCTGFVTCAAAWLFRGLLLRAGAAEGWANAATALTVLGSPAWHYGRTIFCEPYLLCLTLFSYHCLLYDAPRSGARGFAAGVAIGVGLLMKPPFLLIGVPLCVLLAQRRDWRTMTLLAAPVVLAVATLLVLNDRWFGAPLNAAQPWRSGNPLVGVAGFLFRWDRSVFICAPIMVLAVAAWPRFIQVAGQRAWIVGGGIVPYVLLMSLWEEWHGGYCYGPRLILPVLPLACLSLAVFPDLITSATPASTRRWVGFLMGSSLAMNLASVIFFRTYWGGFPLLRVFME